MICNKIIDNNHLFTKENKYIVDTNVLIALYGNKKYNLEIKKNPKLKKAVEYYNKALEGRCTIYVPAIVLSEFVNLFFKESFNELQSKSQRRLNIKKDYRDTQNYLKDCRYIQNVIEKTILSVLEPINDDFNELSVKQMFRFDNDDFNDRLIIHIANKNNLYVISADADVAKIKVH